MSSGALFLFASQARRVPGVAPRRAAASRPSPRVASRAMAASSRAEESDERLLALAHTLADAAGAVCRRHFRTPLAVDAKADASPVTIADREAEAAMRALLRLAVPSHAVFGEEGGLDPGVDSDSGRGPAIAEWTWVLDPIDGTKSFVTGKPLFGTLVSLLHRGLPVLGIIDQPILRERWVGLRNAATTLNGAPVRARACANLVDAFLYATTPHMFAGRTAAPFARVRDAARVPMYGCDCYAYGLLSSGFCDLVIEADLKPYDYMALVPIVQGAGGVMTDWEGKALRWDAPPAGTDPAAGGVGEVLAAGDARTHAAALKLLDWRR